MLNCLITETESAWGAKTEFLLASILDVFEENPFAPFAKMELNDSLLREPYQRSRIVERIVNDGEGRIYLTGDKPHPLMGSLLIKPAYNILQLNIDEKYIAGTNSELKVIAFLYRIKSVLPHFYKARINAFAGVADFYLNNRLAALPVCFEYYLGWFTLLSPRAYESFYSLADLSQTPAQQISVSEQAEVSLTAYQTASSYYSGQSQEDIIRITEYLNRNRRDV